MANILSQHWLLSRRHVLRGLGVSLALPLLDCMRPLRAGRRPRRGPNAACSSTCPTASTRIDYQITQAGRGLQASRSRSQSLEKHRQIITPISGLHHPHGLGHHHNCSTIWLTGGKIGPSERNTISVDQLMAQVTAPQTRFSSLELSNQGHSLAYSADGIGLPAQGNPERRLPRTVRGTARRHRQAAARLAAPRQHPRCRPRRSQLARQPARPGRPRPAGAVSHLRARSRDSHPAGRQVARHAAARRSIRPCSRS